MADASYTQNSFLGGEVAKVFQGRTERPEYRTEMTLCLNGFPVEQGAWSRRPGTRYAGITRAGFAAKVLTFNFTRSSPYTIELTDQKIRMRSGSNLVTRGAIAVSGISASTPAVVTTATPHNLLNFDMILFSGLGLNNPLLQQHQFLINNVTPTTFQLLDGWTAAPVNGSTLGAFVSGTINSIMEIFTPWVGTAFQAVRIIQADIPTPSGSTPGAIFLHPATQPRILAVTSLPTPTAFATFDVDTFDAMKLFNFKDGPYFDPVQAGALLTSSDLTGIVTLTQSFQSWSGTTVYALDDFVIAGGIGYQSLTDGNIGLTPASNPASWKVVSIGSAIGPNGFVSSDIGRHIRLYSEPPVWDPAASYATGANVAFGGTYWKALTAASAGVQPGINASTWAVNPTGARWTWGKIVSLSTTGQILLSAGTPIGNATNAGGLAAAFDNVLSKPSSSCAADSPDGYVGKDFGGTPLAISSVSVWPSSDLGFSPSSVGIGRLWLRASNTLPTFPSNGTILGFVDILSQASPVQVNVTSSDLTTTWRYVWVEYQNFTTPPANVFFSQVQFFGASASAGIAVNFQIIGDPLLYKTPNTIRTWRMGLYSDTTGWPSCGTYHEGRLWLSGTIGNRIDGSVSNKIHEFGPTNPDGTVTAERGISYTFAAPDINPIFWMEPDQLGIVCGTQAGEWLVQSTSNNVPITPTTIQAHRATKAKCANILPQRTGNTLTIVQLFKRKLLEYFADVFSGKFLAQNLAEKAPHLTPPGIEEIIYQQELAPIIWCRMGDGTFRSVTYKRETTVSSQPPNFYGWARHVLGDQRVSGGTSGTAFPESFCIGASDDGLLETLTMVVFDSLTSRREVHVLTNLFTETDHIADAWFLDGGMNPSSVQTVGSTVHLNGLREHAQQPDAGPNTGKIVTVFAGGLDLGQYVVPNNGTLVITFFGGFTSAFAATLTNTDYVVGYCFLTQAQIVRPATAQESGARNGPALGKLRRTHMYGLQAVNTNGLSIGTVFGKFNPVLFKNEAGVIMPGSGTTYTGVYWDSISDDYSFESALAWQVTRPVPAIIPQIAAMLHTQDN